MRIVWTKEEKRALRDCMIDICYVTPTMSNKGLLQHAQEEVIPYERRSKITDQRVFNYKNLINEARAAAEKHRQTVSKPKPAPTPQPVIAPEPVKKLDTLGEVFELFIDALADRIMAKLAAKQPREIPPMTPEDYNKVFDELYPLWKNTPLQPNPMEMLDKLSIRKPPVKKRPTVLVIGLNGCQMETIKTYKPDLDYTFLTAEAAVSHHTVNRDHTILMTKFINHSVQAKYRKHPNLHYCNGGVSELKHMLQVIFHKEYA
jgi:hypothetical protein